MEIITNVDDAMKHFLSSDKPIICRYGNQERTCHSYQRAANFFEVYKEVYDPKAARYGDTSYT